MAIEEVSKTVFAPIKAGRDFIDGIANRAIVKPKHAKGIGGFIFDYDGEVEVLKQAYITDHYSESGKFFQDHITLQPIRIRMHGIVSELIMKKKEGLVGALSQIQNGLTIVPAYLGRYTPSQLKVLQGALTKAQTIVNAIDQTIARAQNLVGIVSEFFGSSTDSRQKQAYQFLSVIMDKKIIVSVETPYEFYKQMAIESLTFMQDADSKTMSQITVTLKEIRFVESKTIQKDPSNSAYFAQNQNQVKKGDTQGKDEDESLLYSAGKYGLNSLKKFLPVKP